MSASTSPISTPDKCMMSIPASGYHGVRTASSGRDGVSLIQFRSMRNRTLGLLILCAALVPAAALDQKDIEFARPGGKALFVDFHVPDGPGPFRAAILIHGGGFDEGSRSTNVRPL